MTERLVAGRATAFAGGTLIDFGRELYARISLRLADLTPARVWLGESAAEAVGPFRELRYDPTRPPDADAFRFAFLPDTPPEGVRSAAASDQSPDWPQLGAFHCSDPLLDRIWQTGADTVRLCGGDVILDGIKRDRRPWMGDLTTAGRVIAAAFGPRPEVPRTANGLRDAALRDGTAEWVDDIPTYSLWWLVHQAEWRLRAEHDLAPQLPFLEATLQRIAGQLADDGREAFDGWRFLDWATMDPDDVAAGTQALLVVALRAAGELAAQAERDDLRALAERLGERARAAAGRDRPNVAVTALRVLAGLQSPAGGDATFAERWPAGMTPFLGEPLLRAWSRFDTDSALEAARAYWGAMLAAGATTWWEDFDLRADAGFRVTDPHTPPGGRLLHAGPAMSLCHGWSTGPTAWLTDTVLGVRSRSAGFRTFHVAPLLGGLSWAEGKVPTPFGAIQVRHERNGGTVRTMVAAPPECRRMLD